jgi:hypothetical protein
MLEGRGNGAAADSDHVLTGVWIVTIHPSRVIPKQRRAREDDGIQSIARRDAFDEEDHP